MAGAARSSNAPIGLAIVGGGLICGFAAGFIWPIRQASSEFWTIIAAVGAIVGVLSIISLTVRAIHSKRGRRSALQKAAAAVKLHLPSLVRKRDQLVREDAYGKPRLDDWIQEISYFIEEHIKPSLTLKEQLAVDEQQSQLASTIYAVVENESERNRDLLTYSGEMTSDTFSDEMTSEKFETSCVEQLRRAGWNVRMSNHGADVVAEKHGIRVVIQCSLSSGPVAEKAIKQIAAAKTNEQADYRVVVSNNRYTQEAEQLASANNILLLHDTDLPNLHDIIPVKTPAWKRLWYYADWRGQQGPVTLKELRDTLAAFPDTSEVLVWCEGFADWKPVRDIPELAPRKTQLTSAA